MIMKALMAQLIWLIVQTSDGFSPIHSHLHHHRLADANPTQLASMRPPPQDNYFDDEEDDEWMYETRSPSREERELRNIQSETVGSKKRGADDDSAPIAYSYSKDYDEEEDEFLEDEYLEEEEGDYIDDNVDRRRVKNAPETGNFWSNPKEGLDDPAEIPLPRQRRSRPMPPSTAMPRRRPSNVPGSRTTFRSGTPPSSDAFGELYDRLFWYGMDEEDGDWVPKGYDKTVFGGTRGKFDALAYLEDGYEVRPPPRRIKRRLPSEDDDDMMEDGRYERPPPPPRSIREDDVQRRPRTPPPPRQQREAADYDFEDRPRTNRDRPRTNSRGWEEKEVTDWFDEGETDNDDDYADNYYDDDDEVPQRPRRRRRPKEAARNPLTQFLDGLMDVDRADMESKAELYEQNVGRRPMPKRAERQRRPTNVYKFDEDSIDEFVDAIDIDDTADDVSATADSVLQEDDIILDVEIEPEGEENPKQEKEKATPKPRMSWEERSRRLERVPPAGIPAWGPSGDLGIDARTKAMLDGMEELREARVLLEEKVEQRSLARDEIVILRADASMETKKRQANPRRSRERLRQIQLDIEDAARDLRKAQSEEDFMRRRLEILQDKHWAVLSIYDANKASQVVDETLSDFSQKEPAARAETVKEGGDIGGQEPATKKPSSREEN